MGLMSFWNYTHDKAITLSVWSEYDGDILTYCIIRIRRGRYREPGYRSDSMYLQHFNRYRRRSTAPVYVRTRYDFAESRQAVADVCDQLRLALPHLPEMLAALEDGDPSLVR